MNIKQVEIDGKAYTMKANALLPRRYREMFGADLITELNHIQQGGDFTVLENLAFLMIKTAGEQEIGTIEEWLESIENPLAITFAANDILALWFDNQKTTSVPRKK